MLKSIPMSTLPLLVLSTLIVSSACVCAGNTVSVVQAYVDLFGGSNPVIIATSDGGAAMSLLNSATGKLRVVKLNSQGKVDWVNEQNTLCNVAYSSYTCYPKTIAEDVSASTLYVAGSISGGAVAFVAEYARTDGTYVSAVAVPPRDTTAVTATEIRSLLIPLGSSLVIFGGFYVTTVSAISTNNILIGTVDTSSLGIVYKTLSFSSALSSSKTLLDIAEERPYYIFTGVLGAPAGPWYSWIAAVDRSSWAVLWKYECSTSISYGDTVTIVPLGSYKYAVMAGELLYVAWYGTGVLSSTVLSGVQTPVSISMNRDMLMVLGATSGGASFAYYYDYNSNCNYDQGSSIASVDFMDSSHSSYYSGVWTAGILASGTAYPLAFVAKLDSDSAIYCVAVVGVVNYLNQACYTTTSTNCFGQCTSCLIASNPNACATIDASTANPVAAASFFSSRCLTPNTYYDSATLACVPIISGPACHPLCGGECIAASDPARCASHCTAVEPNIDDSALGWNTCGCASGSSYNVSVGHCMATGKCHPLCGNNGCLKAGSQAACLLGCNPTATSQVELWTGVYRCQCATGSLYDGSNCLTVLTEGCYSLCADSECTEAGNQEKCLACRTGKNVLSSVVRSYFQYCRCVAGTTLIGNTCGYSENCSVRCDGCISQNNASACIACKSGLTAVDAGDGNLTCACTNSSTMYYNGTCIPYIVNETTCHPLCSGLCFAAGDPTLCLYCTGEHVVSTNQSGDAHTCACENGTHLTASGDCVADIYCDSLCEKCKDESTCVRCPDQEGMRLQDGKCICSIELGYTMMSESDANSTCMLKVNSNMAVTQYTGSGIMVMVILSTATGLGRKSVLWKYITLAQELMLLSVINSPHVSQSLASAFQGCSFVNFGIFDWLVNLLPAGMVGESGYNALEDNSQFHPAISGKMFLANLYCHFVFTILSILCLIICLALAERSEYFKKRADEYLFTGAIFTLQACFVDVTLAAFVQIKHFSVYNGLFFSFSSFAACAALACEILFILGSAYLLYFPPTALLGEDFVKGLVAIHDGLKKTWPAVLTNILHDARLLIMICMLVFLSDHCIVQATMYLILTTAGMAWDLAVRPYSGIVIAGEVLFMHSAKLASAVGYVVLSFSSISEGLADGICLFEMVVLVAAMSAGLTLPFVEQACDLLAKCCFGRNDPTGKVAPLSDTSTNISKTQQSTVVTRND